MFQLTPFNYFFYFHKNAVADFFCYGFNYQEHADMIDKQCKADQEKFNKVRLLLVCIVL